MRKLIVLSALFVLLSPEAGRAESIGSTMLTNQGIDQFGTPVGTEGTPVLGNDALDAGVLSDLVGQGGNAVTVCFPDALAPAAATFQITVGGGSCGSSGTQSVALSAANGAEICSDIGLWSMGGSINQGCSDRGTCTYMGNPGREMDLVGPFLCNITDWRFLTGSVPAAPTYVQITGLTDGTAATVDMFSMTVGGVLRQIGPLSSSFDSVTTGVGLAAVITTLPGITASYSGGTLTITATSTGPIAFTGLRLETTTPATTTTATVSGLSDASAALVNSFTMSIDGAPIDASGIDFSAITDMSSLASALDGLPGIDVLADCCTMAFSASSPGARVFTGPFLASLPELATSAGSVEFVENGAPVVVDDAVVFGLLAGAAIQSVIVENDNAVDGAEETLAVPVTAGLMAGWDPMAQSLTLTGTFSVLEWEAILATVTYSHSGEYPDETPRQIAFRAFDGVDWGPPSARTVEPREVNDIPVLTLGSSPTVRDEAGPQLMSGWATEVSPGPAAESGQGLMISTMTDMPGLFSVEPAVALNGDLTFTPTIDVDGVATVTVTLTDDGGVALGGEDTVMAMFTITIGANSAPVFVPPSPSGTLYVDDGELLSFTVAADDPEFDPVTLAGITLPPTLSFNPGTGEVSWTPTYDDIGMHTVVLSAGDHRAASNTLTLTVMVEMVDADGDELPDNWELDVGLDPTTVDSDGDGITDTEEVEDWQNPSDTDLDTILDALDGDSDDDGVLDADEAGDESLMTPALHSDDDGVADFRDLDSDDDGVDDGVDNCRILANADQLDADGNGVGDVCDVTSNGGCGCATSRPTGTSPMTWLTLGLLGLFIVRRRRRALRLASRAGGERRI